MKSLLMKPCRCLKTSVDLILVAVLACCLLVRCSSKKDTSQDNRSTGNASGTEAREAAAKDVQYEVAEDKASLAAFYALDHIREWYPERVLPPAFDYGIDLSDKSLMELWLLRNEIFARNGYLFEDAVLRGHFNQFKWYQPIFDVPDFKVQLNAQEQAFIAKVVARENELMNTRYVRTGAHKMISLDHVYNLMQFKTVSGDLHQQLAETNFAIVPAEHEQFFHVYDRNHYQYIPNFITTDFYLQVLHKHFSTILQKIEEDKFIPLLAGLLKDVYQQSLQYEKATRDARLQKAAQWSTVYLAVALDLITGKAQPVSPGMNALYGSEVKKVREAEGFGSDFLATPLMQYSQFKPRGNYTKSPDQENYFRCMKWLNTAPVYTDDDERFLSAVLIASFIKRSPSQLASFERFNDAIKFIVGDEDNVSIANLIQVISPEEANDPALLNNAQKLKALREQLEGLYTDRIRPSGGEAEAAKQLSRPALLFTAGRYTFDAEMLSRLIHVLRPEPKRTFPKGLDVFASLGSAEAEKILLREYNEGQHWEGYPEALQKVKETFTKYADWDRNIYSKTMEAITSLNSTHAKYPLFMQTPSWARKNLITSLAAWTELKHDMLLYAEQPYAAQAGEGGGPPPPQHLSYVEPNVKFWEKALALIDFQEKTLTGMDLMNEHISGINEDLREIANLLLAVSRKQLANEKITRDEFDQLSWLGGRIEYLTFRIFGSDHLPEKERLVALVADVYQYNGVFLEEAVGMVDEIYVVAEINGKPYLTKGAVFSYYEFTSTEPLTDEVWREELLKGEAPPRPVWVNDITVKTGSLESKPTYSF